MTRSYIEAYTSHDIDTDKVTAIDNIHTNTDTDTGTDTDTDIDTDTETDTDKDTDKDRDNSTAKKRSLVAIASTLIHICIHTDTHTGA